MSPVQKRSQPGDSAKRHRIEPGTDPAREKTNPGDPAKINRHEKEELPNIGDPLPEKGDKLISIKRNAKNKNN
jgi:hypothetical protein